uniref:Uncharacterized protein n=1 Tax=Anguilla anguilla TaxID=7936 RepID=A0A0E9TJ96_ANGAN
MFTRCSPKGADVGSPKNSPDFRLGVDTDSSGTTVIMTACVTV